MKRLNAQLRRLQQRLVRREEVVAGVVLGVLAIGGFAFTLTTHTGTPAGAALAYMAAVDRADTEYVWSHSILDSSKSAPADRSFFNRASLSAQLKSTAHTRSGFEVQGVSYVTTGTKVTLNFNAAGSRAKASLVMRGSGPHTWPVLLQPTGLEISVPTGVNAFAIDGETLDVTSGSSLKVAVFPGQHRVSLNASHLYAAYTRDVDVEAALPAMTRVSFVGVKVTDQAAGEAKAAVAKALQSCVAATVLRPSGCPQSYTIDTATSGPAWTLVGEPTAGATVGLNDTSTLQVAGQYLMRLSYGSEVKHRQRNILLGGPYTAALGWDGQTLSVSGFSAVTGASQLARPAATDDQVLAWLRPHFASCLKLQAGEAPQCPQHVSAFYASNFVWRANSDALQGAAVAWDATQGFFTVTGNYDFAVDYNSTPPYTATRRYHDHTSGQYVADLYWDGAKAVFVGFE
jgi:hypothetical protein